MKNSLVVAIISISLLSSCIAECDTSTAQGAASCLCEIGDEILMSSDDKEKVKGLLEKQSAYIKEMEKAYTEGKYTKNEMEAILQDRNCSF
jgi:hypothetical protein